MRRVSSSAQLLNAVQEGYKRFWLLTSPNVFNRFSRMSIQENRTMSWS